jgi:hypothetical protein
MEHFVEADDLLHRIRGPGLLSIPKGGIGNKDLIGGINEDKLIIEFYPANLFVRKDTPIEVWLLDIQERVLLDRGPALKGLLPGNGHIFSSKISFCRAGL